jgi:hypothetical protein
VNKYRLSQHVHFHCGQKEEKRCTKLILLTRPVLKIGDLDIRLDEVTRDLMESLIDDHVWLDKLILFQGK